MYAIRAYYFKFNVKLNVNRYDKKKTLKPLAFFIAIARSVARHLSPF